MLIVTAKLPRRALALGGLLAAIVLCAGTVLPAFSPALPAGVEKTAPSPAKVRSNEDRVAYLAEYGWDVSPEPVSTEELLIPEEMGDTYQEYLRLQQEQGFDLTQYCGRRVKRYTYTVTNYPDRKDVSAVLLIYKNRIVGGQIQSADGTILHGLAVPNEKA